MSKGSKQRPRQISQAEYDQNWANIYGKRKNPTVTTKYKQCLEIATSEENKEYFGKAI